MKPAIIVDFDGTLSDTKHREHFVLSRPKQWQNFFQAADKDPLHQWCKDIILAMHQQGHAILILTGRPESMRELSLKWLSEHQIPFDKLFMRESDDFRDDPVIKWEIYNKSIKPEYNTLFILEDRKRVVEMWREQGLTCLQCAPGDF